jgi:glyoxylase-like metal-dependent hydrolase (beta-lactamase superfamily II)
VTLLDRGLVDVATGDTALAEGVTAFELPGHDAGHMGVRIASDGAAAVVTVDVAPHAALLDEPSWRFAADADPETCEGTRRALLAELCETDMFAVCGHYPGGGIGRIVTRDDRSVWEHV